MAKSVMKKAKLTSVDELLGISNEESSIELGIGEIVPFKHHPFKVKDDAKMKELVESIRENGILTPVIVRPLESGGYEMISGHRRMHAAKQAGLTTLPAIIRELDNEEATIVMVEANSQREEVLPSEKAFSYKMKYEAIKSQAGRPSKNSPQIGTNFRADEMVAKMVGESKNQVYRFIRLTELIPEILEMVDSGKLAVVVGVDMSYLEEPVQKLLHKFMQENGPMKYYQVTAVRKYIEDNGNITAQKLKRLFENNMNGRGNRKVVLPDKKLKQYFSSNYTPADMEKIIYRLLENWKAEKEAQNEENHESIRAERTPVQADTDDHPEGTVAEGSGL